MIEHRSRFHIFAQVHLFLDSIFQNHHDARVDTTQGQLALAPLGAGDLIDRAVRLYRRHFLTLIRIAAPPVVVSAVGSTVITVAARAIGATSDTGRLMLYILTLFGGAVIFVCGLLFSLVVMGGGTRNLVAHLLWDEPVSFRATYRAVKSRFWSLLWASCLVGAWLTFCAGVAFTAFYIVFALILLAAFALGSIGAEWLIVYSSLFVPYSSTDL